MGIQSTRYITREAAIHRIDKISAYILLIDYKGLDGEVSEPDYSLEEFINTNLPLRGVDSWTNKMLADKMDEPFYRFSMFDNYIIQEG